MALTPQQLRTLHRSNDRENRVRAARRLLGLTQVELCTAIGITQPQLSDIERQRYGGITVDNAGFVYVTEFNVNNRVQKFTSDGTPIMTWNHCANL